jgi:glycosyltransferase 2 family protein
MTTVHPSAKLVLPVVGLVLVAAAVGASGPDKILEHLAGVGPAVGWLVLAYAAGTAVGALPWAWLIRNAPRPRLATAVVSRFAASGANAVLPLLGFGGDLSRLAWLLPVHRSAGLAAMLVDRLTYIAATGVFRAALSMAVLATDSLPPLLGILALAGSALAILVALGAAWLLAHGGVAARSSSLIARWRFTRQLLGPAAHLDAELRAIFAARRSVVAALAAHVVGRTILALEVYAGLHVLGADVGLGPAAVLAGVPLVLGLAVSWVPSQLGVHETAQALVAAALGLDPSLGVALVLLQRLRQVLFVSVAGALFIAMPARQPAE